MQRPFIVTAFTLFVFMIIVFILVSALGTRLYSDSYTENPQKHEKTAFVTVLCDISMTNAVLVSLFSLKNALADSSSDPSTDILVLVPHLTNISSSVDYFKALNVKLIETGEGYQSTDACKSTLDLWSMFDYKKIIYFSPNVLFREKAHKLLQFPGHSAITTNAHESAYGSLIVIEPNPYIANYLLKYQTHNPELSLSQLLQKTYLSWDRLVALSLPLVDTYLTVFENPIKPWNFHHYSSADWKSYYNPVTFYEWRKSHNAMREKYTPLKEWSNQQRQQSVCDTVPAPSPSARTPITTAFSALVSTYNPERIEHLSLLIRHLLRSDKVDTVFITWHNPALKVPSSFWEAIPASEHSRVRILYQEFDSLNNRFNPVAELETEAVYILDDDVFVDLADLEFAFQVWQTRKDSVVGHFPRYHAYNASLQLGFYKIPHGEKNQYSMVLTKSMFIRSEYLFVYTCLMDPEMHQWIDERLNCEDIGFSMLASGLSGTSATVVRTQEPIIDFGLKNGISLSNGHMNERSKCIHDFIHRFWEENDPLLMVHDTVVPFQLSALRRGNWDKIESQLQAYAV